MSAAGAVVVRIGRSLAPSEPLFRTEYLALDGAVPVFSPKRHEALFFHSLAEAAGRARAIPKAMPAACEEVRL